ncbi:MAG: hypothetical protein KGI97_05775 [Alphaproteobacteria bacterium]|nr:hypothetical protein [Alphaproteobacteria bacterium]
MKKRKILSLPLSAFAAAAYLAATPCAYALQATGHVYAPYGNESDLNISSMSECPKIVTSFGSTRAQGNWFRVVCTDDDGKSAIFICRPYDNWTDPEVWQEVASLKFKDGSSISEYQRLPRLQDVQGTIADCPIVSLPRP